MSLWWKGSCPYTSIKVSLCLEANPSPGSDKNGKIMWVIAEIVSTIGCNRRVKCSGAEESAASANLINYLGDAKVAVTAVCCVGGHGPLCACSFADDDCGAFVDLGKRYFRCVYDRKN